MRIDVRQPAAGTAPGATLPFRRQGLGRLQVDPAARPTKMVTELVKSTGGQEVFLNWEGALDDAGRLRRCVICSCSDLFQEKAFPQVTGIVIVLAFAGAAAGLLGLVTNLPVLILMTLVLVLDVGILVFSKRRLVCYRCRSNYHDLPIARYHRRWERATADRYAAAEEQSREAPDRERPILPVRARSVSA